MTHCVPDYKVLTGRGAPDIDADECLRHSPWWRHLARRVGVAAALVFASVVTLRWLVTHGRVAVSRRNGVNVLRYTT